MKCAIIAAMALPKDYTGEGCSLARALEVVGERWTLLVVRDAFFGIRRFTDFVAHLDIPRAVLTHRLGTLVAQDVLTIVPGAHGHDEYVLTAKGLDLWPVVRTLMNWGDDYYSVKGPRRLFHHALDGGDVPPDGACADCGDVIPAADLVVAPGPGWAPTGRTDAATTTLSEPHRLLTSIRA
jgi:DNA-binding HxlR family transcriptional regulator